MMEKVIKVYILLLFCIVGCHKNQPTESLEVATFSALAVPVAAGYYSSVASIEAYQTGALALLTMDLPIYVREINRTELDLILWELTFNCKNLRTQLIYLGSKDNYHYLTLSPVFGFRPMYRINKNEYRINHQFPLTVNFYRWVVLSEHGHAINFNENPDSPFHKKIEIEVPYNYHVNLGVENFRFMHQDSGRKTLNENFTHNIKEIIAFKVSEEELKKRITANFRKKLSIGLLDDMHPFDFQLNPLPFDDLEPEIMDYFQIDQ